MTSLKIRRLNVRLTLLALMIVGGLGSAEGQQASLPSHLSLADAVRLAMEGNPALRSAQASVDIAAAQRLEASRRLNPALTVDSQGWRALSPDQGPFFKSQELTARLDYEIETRGKRELRTQAAEFNHQAAQEMRENQKRQIVLEAKRLYTRAALAEANLQLAQTVLGEIDKIIVLNRDRYAKGEISGSELRRSEVERMKFQDDVLAAELERSNAKSSLLAWLGFPDELAAGIELTDELVSDPEKSAGAMQALADTPLMGLQAQALERRPDLASATRDVLRAEVETRLQHALRSPNITVGGGYKRDGPFNTLVLGATVPLQVFNRNEGGVARAAAEATRAGAAKELIRTALLLEVQQAYNAVQSHRQRVRYIREQYLSKAEQSRDIVAAAYRLGEVGLIDLLDAERANRETRKVLNQALNDYSVSLYELAAAIGEGN
jgi:cobalt-zinc-cadmium efflux system outer membrane protein